MRARVNTPGNVKKSPCLLLNFRKKRNCTHNDDDELQPIIRDEKSGERKYVRTLIIQSRRFVLPNKKRDRNKIWSQSYKRNSQSKS